MSVIGLFSWGFCLVCREVGVMWRCEGVMIIPDVINGGFRCGDGAEMGSGEAVIWG